LQGEVHISIQCFQEMWWKREWQIEEYCAVLRINRWCCFKIL